jgi:PA14 domain
MIGLTGSRLWQRSIADENFGASPSANLGITQNTRWSSRWVGQVRLEAAGAYSFAVNSTDGHRLIVDGERLADTAIGSPGATTTAPRDLTAGWHDVAIDLHVNAPSNNAPATLSLKPVANAPEFAGVPLPNNRFRPVVTGTERLFTAQDNSQVNVPNNSTLVRTINTDGVPNDAIITGIDLSYRAVPGNGRTINVSLTDPTGLVVPVGNGGNNTVLLALADFNTRAAAGAWKLSIDNTGNNRQAQVSNFAITLHYSTLSQPAIATSASYESSQHDFAVPVTLTSVAWLERQAAVGAIKISVRACVAACTNEPFVAVAQNGTVPAGLVGQFVQYRAAFVSNGITVPALDKITIIGAE